MRNRITFISVSLNIVLFGAILFVVRKPQENLPIQSVSEVSNVIVAQIEETILQTNLISQTAPAPFDWSQIESEDFSKYADNLRSVGCPEETVRDILTAKINDLFVHRRQDLFRPLQSQFWDLMAQGGDRDLIPKETEEKLDALVAEKDALLKKIFPKPSEEKNASTTEYEAVLADTLSPEKVQQLRDTVEKFNKLREIIQSSGLPEVVKEKTVALDKQSSAAQKNILSPEELEEFNLRKSPFAQNRQNLFGFQASEDELRAMALLTANDKPVPTDKNSPDFEAKLAEQRAEKVKMDGQLKVLLGENRFEDYERAKNFNFRNLSQLARRYDLSPQTSSEVYDLTTSVFQEVRAFKKSNLDSDERDEALETIRQQTERAMIAKLGVRAAETYRRNFGNWDEIPDP